MSESDDSVTSVTHWIDTHKLKRPSLIDFVPDFAPHAVGLIAFAWSAFQVVFDQRLTKLLAESAEPPEGWRRRNFKKRRELFREQVLRAFGSDNLVLSYFNKILDDAAGLYIDRNLITHGRVAISVDGKQHGLSCTGWHNGKEISRSYSKDRLDDLYYEICHLAGRVALVSSGLNDPAYASLDISPPQAVPQTNPPLPPIEGKSGPRLESSPE